MIKQDRERAKRQETVATRRGFLATTGAIGTGLLAGCVGRLDGPGGSNDDDTKTEGGSNSSDAWRSIDLSPVRGGDSFTLGDFDRPVVLETFAVWCPKCEKQQRKLRELDDSVVIVSLNTDSNEGASKVRSHANEKGFDWRFAVAPTEMTQSLIDEFGPTVTNAPSTPVIVACQGGSAEFLSGEINTAEAIADAARECE